MKRLIILFLIILLPLYGKDKEDTLLGEIITEESTIETNGREFNKYKKNNPKNSKNLKEVMEKFSSVHFNIGSRGEALFNIRGFSGREIPILINGIPVYMPYSGSMDLFKIDTNLIEEVKLNTGLSSVLYGPNAMGGAINIITKIPQKGVKSSLKAELGLKSYNLGVNLGYREKHYYFLVNTNYLKSEGYFMPKSGKDIINENVLLEDRGIRYNSQKEKVSGLLKGGYEKGDFKTEVSFLNINESRGMPVELNNPRARYWKFPIWKKNTLTFLFQNPLNNTLKLKLRSFYDSYYNKLEGYKDFNFKKLKFNSIYDDYSYGFILNPEFNFSELSRLEFSVYYKHDLHRSGDDEISLSDYEKYAMDTFSVAAEYKKETEYLSLLTGFSYDLNTTNTKENKLKRIAALNPQISAIYWIDDIYSVKFSVGQKTRFPTLKELFSGFIDRNIPSPDLKNEKALHYQLFLNSEFEDFMIKAEVFHTEITDTIVNTVVDGSGYKKIYQLQNKGRTKVSGMELSLNTDKIYSYFELFVSYTYQYSYNYNLNGDLPYFPNNLIKTSFIAFLPYKSYLYLFLNFVSSQKEFNKKNEMLEIPSYFLANLKLENSFYKSFKVYLKVNNLFNSYIYTKHNFPIAGREFYLGFIYKY